MVDSFRIQSSAESVVELKGEGANDTDTGK